MFAAENGLRGDPNLQAIYEAIRVVPNFPKPGVEARGFIFALAIALEIVAKFIPLRKPGKLPGAVLSESCELECRNDCLEMHVGAVKNRERALVIDDLIATVGKLSAAIRLLERAGAEVVECACVIGLPEVEGGSRLDGKPVYIVSLITLFDVIFFCCHFTRKTLSLALCNLIEDRGFEKKPEAGKLKHMWSMLEFICNASLHFSAPLRSEAYLSSSTNMLPIVMN